MLTGVQLDFLRRRGARRMRPYGDQPVLPPQGEVTGDAEEAGPAVDRGLEQPPDNWAPIDVRKALAVDRCMPRRFVDGSQIHQTVACVTDPEGRPVPVELAEIGGICVRADGRRLVREFEVVERVVCMIVDPFPWNEIEDFAAGLSEAGLRLLPARPPEDEDGSPALCFDFERMRAYTRFSCRHAMEALEEVAWVRRAEVPTLVDGRLTRFHHRAGERSDVVGVIKRQHADYLHDQGWRVLYALEPGQRTPAFLLNIRNLQVVSWYLKLDGADGAMPNWGVIRAEIPKAQFDRTGGDYGHLDRLSRGILEMRCRRGGSSYARAPVSVEPIVRAEESLRSLLAPLPTLVERFYRIAGL
ncbi:MAG TPA: hypothetical protein VFB66_08990 [Tepidisphaeraceae bacterium]|nr:hypothetical protein [Tepidisphaeraceae bacterium]